MSGSVEVGFTLLGMNISLVAVFVSILFMGGIVERLFREFSLTLAAAILVSLAVSLTLTPGRCSRLLRRRGAGTPSRFHAATDRWFDAVKRGYDTSLGWVLRHPGLVLVTLLGTIALNVAVYVRLPKGFLPAQDTGTLFGFVRGDDAFSYEIMQPKIEAVGRHVPADPAVQDVIVFSGGPRRLRTSRVPGRLKAGRGRRTPGHDVLDRVGVTRAL